MFCEDCNTKPASIHVTQVTDGEKAEHHYCSDCAAKKGISFFSMEEALSLPKILGSFFGFGPTPMSQPALPSATQQRCPNCSTSFHQIGQQGRFGCSECYTAFQDQLDPILRRIHGNNQHMGKVPLRGAGKIKIRRQIAELKAGLQDAVAQEQFEKAAELRDDIKRLEKELEQG